MLVDVIGGYVRVWRRAQFGFVDRSVFGGDGDLGGVCGRLWLCEAYFAGIVTDGTRARDAEDRSSGLLCGQTLLQGECQAVELLCRGPNPVGPGLPVLRQCRAR
jgi:hypothetical protein